MLVWIPDLSRISVWILLILELIVLTSSSCPPLIKMKVVKAFPRVRHRAIWKVQSYLHLLLTVSLLSWTIFSTISLKELLLVSVVMFHVSSLCTFIQTYVICPIWRKRNWNCEQSKIQGKKDVHLKNFISRLTHIYFLCETRLPTSQAEIVIVRIPFWEIGRIIANLLQLYKNQVNPFSTYTALLDVV